MSLCEPSGCFTVHTMWYAAAWQAWQRSQLQCNGAVHGTMPLCCKGLGEQEAGIITCCRCNSGHGPCVRAVQASNACRLRELPHPAVLFH